jgi:hypothetical protein
MLHGITVSAIFPLAFNHWNASRNETRFPATAILSLTRALSSFINPI